jgi:hypothetical protein
MKIKILFVSLALLLLAACSGTLSTLDADSGSMSVYPMTSAQADKAVITGMTNNFSGSPISRVEYPNKGYQGIMRFLLDSHSITAYMIPAVGLKDEVKVDGFIFSVSHSGTMVISGSAKAKRVLEEIKNQAELTAKPIPFSSYKP